MFVRFNQIFFVRFHFTIFVRSHLTIFVRSHEVSEVPQIFSTTIWQNRVATNQLDTFVALASKECEVATLFEGVGDDHLSGTTINFRRKYLHLLKEEHSAGKGDHLHGKGALVGTEKANHPPRCYWGHWWWSELIIAIFFLVHKYLNRY